MTFRHDQVGISAGNALVRRILFQDWDPIGVNDEAPVDEYDRYADRVYSMLLDDGVTQEAIATYLDHVAFNLMGFGSSESGMEHSRRTAAMLVSRRPEITSANDRSNDIYDGLRNG